ncbi:DNA cytosine methyltransferase [Promicromonospora kroppenstedtii]|uniref:DNA cytosine methyltransferase n=1 Tax=Promicromonospora kroppenstedtii TaxID=440482 RepID=UPI001B7FADCA|nr:DNA cytosine methyltransferase [Promicromonospora kroppenstedtii]
MTATDARPKILDLYSAGGGAAMGYHRAGFDVYGVELDQDRADHYPFPVRSTQRARHPPPPRSRRARLVRGPQRAWRPVEFLRRSDFAAIHASPPCQANTALTKGNRARGWKDDHVDLIPETRELLDAVGLPYVIENVQGATMRRDLTLCGETFGLGVIRHRYFELGRWSTEAPEHAPHRGRVAGLPARPVVRGPLLRRLRQRWRQGQRRAVADRYGHRLARRPRTPRRSQSPLAYTEFVGARLLKAVTA